MTRRRPAPRRRARVGPVPQARTAAEGDWLMGAGGVEPWALWEPAFWSRWWTVRHPPPQGRARVLMAWKFAAGDWIDRLAGARVLMAWEPGCAMRDVGDSR